MGGNALVCKRSLRGLHLCGIDLTFTAGLISEKTFQNEIFKKGFPALLL